MQFVTTRTCDAVLIEGIGVGGPNPGPHTLSWIAATSVLRSKVQVHMVRTLIDA